MPKKAPSLTTKGESTRERIVRAARRQLIENGYEAFVMRELADMLDMKLGNLQYYFKTRDALILHVIEDEAQQDIATIEAAVEHSESPGQTFKRIVQELVIRWRGHSGVLFSTLSTLAMHNPAFKQLYQAIYQRFYAALESPLKQMNPALTEKEIRLRVRLITALIDGSPMQIEVGDLQTYLQRIQTQAELIALQ